MQDNNETETAAGPGVPRRHEVVIAAAIAAVFGNRAVIQQIHEVVDAFPAAWARRGRAAVQVSHNPGELNRRMPERGQGSR